MGHQYNLTVNYEPKIVCACRTSPGFARVSYPCLVRYSCKMCGWSVQEHLAFLISIQAEITYFIHIFYFNANLKLIIIIKI